MDDVPYFMSNTDIVVLPSITMDDGWGAVVSEALMAGAAVVCSHKVGASLCLADETRGTVVDDLTGANVAFAIEQLITKDLCGLPYRNVRRDWAHAHLTHRVGVEYFLEILDLVFLGDACPP